MAVVQLGLAISLALPMWWELISGTTVIPDVSIRLASILSMIPINLNYFDDITSGDDEVAMVRAARVGSSII